MHFILLGFGYMEKKEGERKECCKTKEDEIANLEGIYALYRRVAEVPGGLARLKSEVDLSYVSSFLTRSQLTGLSLVEKSGSGEIIGEIHAYSAGIFTFSHVLSELSIAVDPRFQNQGIGKRLFKRFITEVTEKHPDILRVELIARESNTHAIHFYESLGFKIEGKFLNRIKNIDGSFESDIPMAWTIERES